MAKKIRGRNEGSLHRRPSGTWRGQVSTSGRRLSRDFRSKPEAQAWLRMMLDQMDRGQYGQAEKMTVAEYLPRWLSQHRASIRPKTAYQYAWNIQRYILPFLGPVQMSVLSLDRIEKYYGELLEAGVSIRTVRIVHTILHRALDKAVRYQLIRFNPSDGASLPRYHYAEMKVFDESQVSQFLLAGQNSPFQALYYLAVTAGLRQGELLGLKWSDLKWVSGTLHVQRQLQYIPGQSWSLVEPKSKSSKRTIKLGENTLQMLRLHKERQETLKSMAGERWNDLDLIFPSSVGTPANDSHLRKDFLNVLILAGLPRIRFHDLRHSCAALLLNSGVPVIAVSRMLGHSKPSVTLDVYGHLYNELQDEAAARMDQLVSPISVQLVDAAKKGTP